MAEPCIADVEAAIALCDFLHDDLTDLLTHYTDECDVDDLDRLHDSKCRTIQTAAQLLFDMKIDWAAYPLSGENSLVLPLDECGS